MTIAHVVDHLGILLTLAGGSALVGFIRNAALGVTFGGLWIFSGVHFTGILVRQFDPTYGWNPSDTLWLHYGWLAGFLIALTMLFLKVLVRKIRPSHG